MQATHYRKVIYVVSLIALVIMLYFVGRPARVVAEADGAVRPDPGGVLAQIRAEHGLAEAQLGRIDPASNTAQLATFGMRGVAVALLWHQAMEQQKRHEWNNVVAVAHQIIFLEPHFVTIWDFLGWTLAYNASAAFDDYRERYRWVIRGIDFLVTGLERNRRSPRLHRVTGWTVSQRLGIADEVEQFRRLLRDDEPFGLRHHAPLPSDRDNWLLGRRWYHWGEELVLRDGISLGNESDFIYFANSRLNLFNYAKWKRRDGIFGEEAIRAWDNAIDEWREFGRMELATAIPTDGSMRVPRRAAPDAVHRTRLEIVDIVREEAEELLEELYAIAPELKEILAIERWQQLGSTVGQQGSVLPLLEGLDDLNPEWFPVKELRTIRNWLNENEPDWHARLTAERNTLIPDDQTDMRLIPSMFLEEEDRAALDMTNSEIAQVQQRALGLLRLSPRILMEEIQELDIPLAARGRARSIVEELDGHRERIRHSDLFRGILNYETRFREVAVERTDIADEAHRLRFEARRVYHEGRLAEAREGWLNAMRTWDELLDLEEFQDRATDSGFVRDRIDLAERFLIILNDSNMIFSDAIREDETQVPLHRIMWQRVFGGDDIVDQTVAALEYAKEQFEQALAETDETRRRESLERAENYFSIVADRFLGMNFRERFMGYAPFFDLRDRILEASAYYIRSLESQGKPLPEPLILRSYVELMLMHDPAVAVANEILFNAMSLIRDERYDEAQTVLGTAVSAWQAILDRYPIIAHDPTNPAYSDIIQLAMQYINVLRAQDKPIPDDFPLRAFLR